MKREEKNYAALDPQNPVRRSILRGAETGGEERRETAPPVTRAEGGPVFAVAHRRLSATEAMSRP